MTDNLAPWRPILARALHRNRSQPHSRYFQLATVTPNGRPTNRTVVFREFLDNTNQLLIITDARSSKISHLYSQPWGEICWYFSKTREQFRIAGRLSIMDENSPSQLPRIKMWQQISEAARQQFTWPEPGQLFSENSQDFDHLPPSERQPLVNFCLLLLEPEKVDHLELREKPHQRQIYQLDDRKNWSFQKVNP